MTYDKRSCRGAEIAICLNLLGRPQNPPQISGTKQESGSLPVTAANRFLQFRDDRTAIELFVTGIGGWESGLRRQIDGGSGSRH